MRLQAQDESRRSRSQVTQAAAELNREAAAAEDAERQPLSQKSMNKAEAQKAFCEAYGRAQSRQDENFRKY